MGTARATHPRPTPSVGRIAGRASSAAHKRSSAAWHDALLLPRTMKTTSSMTAV
jgi:hypothetical protein